MSIQPSNLPFLGIQNKQKYFNNFENSKTKTPLSKLTDQTNVSPKSKQTKVQLITNLSAVKSEPKQKQNIEEENGEKEYTLCLKKALNEAITENDYFREEVERLKKENEELKQQIEDRDNAIVELVACYDYCQLHHLNDCNYNNANNNDDRDKNNSDEIIVDSSLIKRQNSN